MKKALLIAVVAVFAMAAAASASTVSFSWGTAFYNLAQPSGNYNSEAVTTINGTSATLQWYVDDFSLGILNESLSVVDSDGDVEPLTVNELVVDKWLSNSVAVGVGAGTLFVGGSSYDPFYSALSTPIMDIRGTVRLLSGKGEKVSASLDFNIDARFGHSIYSDNFNGVVSTLGVTLGL